MKYNVSLTHNEMVLIRFLAFQASKALENVQQTDGIIERKQVNKNLIEKIDSTLKGGFKQ